MRDNNPAANSHVIILLRERKQVQIAALAQLFNSNHEPIYNAFQPPDPPDFPSRPLHPSRPSRGRMGGRDPGGLKAGKDRAILRSRRLKLVSSAQAEAEVEPQCMTDHPRREAVTLER